MKGKWEPRGMMQQRRDFGPCCCAHSRAAVALPIIDGRMLICRPQVAGIKNIGGSCEMDIIFCLLCEINKSAVLL